MLIERPFEKRNVLWEHLWRAGGRAASKGFPLSKLKSFYPVFIKLDEYVGKENISTKFYNQLNPPMHAWIMAFELSKSFPKLGYPFPKSKCFYPVVIKLGEYVGGHNILTKFYNQPNPQETPEIWPLTCAKLSTIRVPLYKSNSCHSIFVKLGEYVGGHNISTKLYNLPNPTRHSWIMAFELSTIRVSAILIKKFSSSIYQTWCKCW